MYFEDYEVGQTYETPEISFTKEEIIEFGHKYDPRPIHIDEEAAKKSMFKGLIASGFQTMIGTWAQWVKMGIDMDGLICGMQIDKNVWHKPVYPGDVLKGRLTILEKIDRPGKDTGMVKNTHQIVNQKGEIVMDMFTTGLIKKKDYEVR